MATATFERAMTHVFAHEGGFVDHPLDPGGATNLGITLATLSAWRGRTVSVAEVRALTRTEATAIYRARYWDAVRADDLPAGLDYALFDYAIHSGPARAVRALQAIVGVATDGIVGPLTLRAVAARSTGAVIAALCDRRMSLLRRLSTFATFGRGWTSRVDAVRAIALALAGAPQNSTAKDEPMLSGTKSIFASRTIWGALVAILAQTLSLNGIAIPGDAQGAMVDIVLQAIGLAGGVLALWGRLTATQRVK